MRVPDCCCKLLGLNPRGYGSPSRNRRTGRGGGGGSIGGGLELLSKGLVIFLTLEGLIGRTQADAPYDSRNPFEDATQYDNWPPTRHKFSINSDDDAKRYLIKYGYLMCTEQRHKREAPLDLVTEELPVAAAAASSCTEDDLRKAIKKFQLTKQLKPTGELDRSTVELMRQRRCGNKDNNETVHDSQLPAKNRLAKAANITAEKSSMIRSLTSRSESALGASSASAPAHAVKRRSVDIIAQRKEKRLKAREEREIEQKKQSSQRHKELLHGLEENTKVLPRRKRDIRNMQNKSVLSEILKKPDPNQHRWDMLEEYKQKFMSQNVTEYMNRQKNKNQVKSSRGSKGADSDVKRNKRSVSGLHGKTFPKRTITWKISGKSTRIPLYDQFSVFMLAFRMWSEVIDIEFECDMYEPDIKVAFHKKNETSSICINYFDGSGGEVAHSLPQNSSLYGVHFDDEEDYFLHIRPGLNLPKVALHEIGHVVGLGHNDNNVSFLYPIYTSPEPTEVIELPTIDRQMAQSYYGKCTGTFDTIFDRLKRYPCFQQNAPECPFKYRYRYNTYFFKDNMYWLYENLKSRPRYGDPRNTQSKYTLTKFDGAVQIFTAQQTLYRQKNINVYNIETQIFIGDEVHTMDEYEDKVVQTRRISDVYGPKAGQTEGVPNNIDSVYNDMRNEHLYFFKDSWVFEVDPNPTYPSQKGCCESKMRFTTMYPLHPADNETKTIDGIVVPPLTGNIDAAYYSYAHQSLFFIRDEFVWENHFFSSSVGYNAIDQNELIFKGRVNQLWYDICTVKMDQTSCYDMHMKMQADQEKKSNT